MDGVNLTRGKWGTAPWGDFDLHKGPGKERSPVMKCQMSQTPRNPTSAIARENQHQVTGGLLQKCLSYLLTLPGLEESETQRTGPKS